MNSKFLADPGVGGRHDLGPSPANLRAVHGDALSGLSHTKYLRVVLRKSIPTQLRQLVLHISNSEGKIDRFVGELTFAKTTLQNTFCKKRDLGPSPANLRAVHGDVLSGSSQRKCSWISFRKITLPQNR